MSSGREQHLDGMFMSIAQQCGNLPNMLDAFFSFLHRKTDFYVVDPSPKRPMGFAEGQAEALLVRSLRKFKYKTPQQLDVVSTDASEQRQKSQNAAKAKAKAKAKPKAAKKAAPAGADTPAAVTPPAVPAVPAAAAAAADADAGSGAGGGAGADQSEASKAASLPNVRYTDEGLQIPIGNGGVGANYTWTQTLEEVTIYIEVPAGTRSQVIDCRIKPTSLHVSLKGQAGAAPLLDGTLPYKIKASESMWTVESRQTIVISLEKVVQTWWKSVVKGDPEIDATKVDSTRKVTDYDDETQAAIRKIMFEQRQKMMVQEAAGGMMDPAAAAAAAAAAGSGIPAMPGAGPPADVQAAAMEAIARGDLRPPTAN